MTSMIMGWYQDLRTLRVFAKHGMFLGKSIICKIF